MHHFRSCNMLPKRCLTKILSSYLPVQGVCSRTLANKPAVKTPGAAQSYVVGLYTRYVAWYERHLETRFPKAYEVYQLFKTGLHSFYDDTMSYFSITTSLRGGKQLNEFTRKELQTYRQLPSDVWKVMPILFIGALPFGVYLVLPLGVKYPKQLLSPQFWSTSQFQEFSLEYHIERLKEYSPVLHHLEKAARHILDPRLKTTFYTNILDKIDSGSNPTVADIVDVQSVFSSKPLGLPHLSYLHERHLAKSLDMPVSKKKLLSHGSLIKHIDVAARREGYETLTQTEVEQMCFVRGMNPLGMEREVLVNFLKEWSMISRRVEDDSISMLLHAPVLLNCNHHGNRKFITSPWNYKQPKT